MTPRLRPTPPQMLEYLRQHPEGRSRSEMMADWQLTQNPMAMSIKEAQQARMIVTIGCRRSSRHYAPEHATTHAIEADKAHRAKLAEQRQHRASKMCDDVVRHWAGVGEYAPIRVSAPRCVWDLAA